MGLDLVELVMEVEDAFGISISDEDVPTLETVGSLHQYVSKQVGERLRTPCLTAVAFYRLRRSLMSVLQVSRNELRPSTDLRQLIPSRGRRAVWRRLQASLGLKLPEPSLSRVSLVVVVIAPFVAGLGCYWGRAFLGDSQTTAQWAPFLAAAVAFLITLTLASYFAGALRADLCTVGGLARGIVAHNYTALTDQVGASRETDLWDALRFIICEQLDLKPETVTKETRLADLASRKKGPADSSAPVE